MLPRIPGARMLEMELQRRPLPAEAVIEHVAEHAEGQLRILAPEADAAVIDLVLEGHVVPSLAHGQGRHLLVRRKVADQIAQAGAERRRVDRHVADRPELPRLEVDAEAQAEIVVLGFDRRVFEHPAILAEADLVDRVLQHALVDLRGMENPLHIAAEAAHHVGDARRRGGEHLRSGWCKRRRVAGFRHEALASPCFPCEALQYPSPRDSVARGAINRRWCSTGIGPQSLEGQADVQASVWLSGRAARRRRTLSDLSWPQAAMMSCPRGVRTGEA